MSTKKELEQENEFLKEEVSRLSKALAQKSIENIKNQRKTRKLIEDLKKRAKALKRQKEKMKEQNEELEQINRVMTGRELKMIELKRKIKELETNSKSEKKT